jgi:hypothetical protein
VHAGVVQKYDDILLEESRFTQVLLLSLPPGSSPSLLLPCFFSLASSPSLLLLQGGFAEFRLNCCSQDTTLGRASALAGVDVPAELAEEAFYGWGGYSLLIESINRVPSADGRGGGREREKERKRERERERGGGRESRSSTGFITTLLAVVTVVAALLPSSLIPPLPPHLLDSFPQHGWLSVHMVPRAASGLRIHNDWHVSFRPRRATDAALDHSSPEGSRRSARTSMRGRSGGRRPLVCHFNRPPAQGPARKRQ